MSVWWEVPSKRRMFVITTKKKPSRLRTDSVQTFSSGQMTLNERISRKYPILLNLSPNTLWTGKKWSTRSPWIPNTRNERTRSAKNFPLHHHEVQFEVPDQDLGETAEDREGGGDKGHCIIDSSSCLTYSDSASFYARVAHPLSMR